MASRAEANHDDSDPEFDPLNPDTREDEGWEDVEPEEEERFEFTSFFDKSRLSSLNELIEYDKAKHNFDLLSIKRSFGLDFISTIKLVNFVRSEVKSGNNPNVASLDTFSDDKYLQPVLEDDAVLFSLGDLDNADEPGIDATGGSSRPGTMGDASDRIAQLEQELRHAQEIISELRLISQRNLADAEAEPSDGRSEANRKERAVRENDLSYFKSYAYNDIHEIMLKDTVRTDAYRDFIYDNKDVFAGKVVLDVGCGTGILSMMCAKAGATKVFAVDNSDIINKARANVYENGLADTVTCLRGKIEEISLPVEKVDIIVSEWMGYALLYESMLDSVIFARDRYLSPGGLMVPSHSTLFIAPIAIPDVFSDRIGFWEDVYGFKMPAMLEGIFDEVLLRNLVEDDIVGTASPFLQLSLHTTKVSDTFFDAKPFRTKILRDKDPVDGYAIWFDMFFARSPESQVASETRARDWKEGVAFSTGPGKATTHWQQVVLLLDKSSTTRSAKMEVGIEIEGDVSYERREENDRQIDISVKWSTQKDGQMSSQKWELA